MLDNVNELISNAHSIDNLGVSSKTLKEVISQIKDALKSNEEALNQVNEIDVKNNNGFLIDYKVIDNIFDIIKDEELVYGNVVLSQKDEDNKLIYGKQITRIGTILVLNDGNPYVMLELILRNILANNSVIFNNNGYMYGTNNLIVKICQSVLEQCDISGNLIQICVSDDYDKLLDNFASIDLIICMGNICLQRKLLNDCKTPVILSGYDNYDIYIESDNNLDFISEIINSKLKINFYLKEGIELDIDEYLVVSDIDEAISQINYNGNKYGCSIFTNSVSNASKFLSEINSKIVTVNTSPSIERLIDIKQDDLVSIKTIIYPLSFKIEEEPNK